MTQRLIDANALIENGHKIQIVVNETDSPFDVIENQGKKFLDLINQAPTVDAEPVRHARWVPLANKYYPNEKFMIGYMCSECRRFEDDNTEPYCHCGAKMDGGADDGKA